MLPSRKAEPEICPAGEAAESTGCRCILDADLCLDDYHTVNALRSFSICRLHGVGGRHLEKGVP